MTVVWGILGDIEANSNLSYYARANDTQLHPLEVTKINIESARQKQCWTP